MRTMLLMIGLGAALAAQAASPAAAMAPTPQATGTVGRSPDTAATMTAIAQAESRRNGQVGPQRVRAASNATNSGPAAAPGSVRLRVPVKLEKMLPEATRVSVHCSVTGDGTHGFGRSALLAIVNGEFDQVIEVNVMLTDGRTSAPAGSYICRLELYGAGNAIGNPRQGTPPSAELYKVARPDRFFMGIVTGPLDAAFVDGITGGGGLAIPPRPRQ